jgi:hypothetical protein
VGSDGLLWEGHDVRLVSIATFVMVLCNVVVFMSGLLGYGIGAFKCYLNP